MRWPLTRPARPGAPALRGPRRDRHGRGVRGPLAWPAVPAMTTRSQRFDDAVLDAAERLRGRLGDRLDDVELAVQLVPDLAPRAPEVPLATTVSHGGRARIILFRRPLEARATSREELDEVVSRVLVEQVAALLFLDPYDLDDHYDPGL